MAHMSWAVRTTCSQFPHWTNLYLFHVVDLFLVWFFLCFLCLLLWALHQTIQLTWLELHGFSQLLHLNNNNININITTEQTITKSGTYYVRTSNSWDFLSLSSFVFRAETSTLSPSIRTLSSLLWREAPASTSRIWKRKRINLLDAAANNQVPSWSSDLVL